jgi:hypothetical protein
MPAPIEITMSFDTIRVIPVKYWDMIRSGSNLTISGKMKREFKWERSKTRYTNVRLAATSSWCLKEWRAIWCVAEET